MELGPYEISTFQSMVGMSDEMNSSVLKSISSIEQSPSLLPIYNLLLLEKYNEAALGIKNLMEKHLNVNYLILLQSSKFYLQRKCVPFAISDLDFPEKKLLLLGCLRDSICDVIREGIKSIVKNSPFSGDELMNIYIDLINHKYMSVRNLAVDIAVLIKSSNFNISGMLSSNNWRLRLRVAHKINEFNKQDTNKIIKELINDPISEVRIELAKNINSLEYLAMLKDPCELVRASYLENILDKIEDVNIFDDLSNDSSWEVKRVLLSLKGELFKKITIPLIKSSTEKVKWRIKHDILGLIEDVIQTEHVAKELIEVLFNHCTDQVCEIRKKAVEILIKILKHHNCFKECRVKIENVVISDNYLHRIAILPLAVEYDSIYKDNLSESLEKDAIVNVRDYFKQYTKENGIIFDRKKCLDLIEDSIEADTIMQSTQEEQYF